MAETFQEKFERLKRSVDESYEILKDINKNHFAESAKIGVTGIMTHNMVSIRTLVTGINKIVDHLNKED
jgi:predicted nucleotide-binding protein (sugar kinase/HSP70/actin superfamily)